MIEEIENYIDRYQLLPEGIRVIVGVSGGVDSMVLLDVLRQIASGRKIKLVIAHLNYSLRGEESDRDEQLVINYCEAHDLEVHVKKVDTQAFAEKNNLGIQIAARKLRYEWFDELKQGESARIAVAHHADDNVETILHNLTRGTGVKGLRGMNPLNEKGVIRPLLAVTKDQLIDHASQHQIIWREDASNQKPDYTRNLIRLKVMPVLKQINPSLTDHFGLTHRRLLGMEELLMDRIADIRSRFFSQENGQDHWKTDWVQDTQKDLLLLSELLSVYQVSFREAMDIHQAILQPMGQLFKTETYRINVDRDRLLVEPLAQARQEAPMPVLKGETELTYGKWQYTMEYVPVEHVKITPDRKAAYLDADLLKFPLNLRKWQQGDRMQPFGMHGQKKISDILIDEKVPNLTKEHIHVLCNEDEIVWLCGIRIGHTCRVTNKTENVLIIEQKPILKD